MWKIGVGGLWEKAREIPGLMKLYHKIIFKNNNNKMQKTECHYFKRHYLGISYYT